MTDVSSDLRMADRHHGLILADGRVARATVRRARLACPQSTQRNMLRTKLGSRGAHLNGYAVVVFRRHDRTAGEPRHRLGRDSGPLDLGTGIYEQFVGFHALEPINLSDYADRTVPIDVVIGRERTQRSQAVKQTDVVALIALLPEEFPDVMAEANFRHYEPRCAHGSSLSAGMHARVAARRGDSEMALRYLRRPRLPTSTSTLTAPVVSASPDWARYGRR